MLTLQHERSTSCNVLPSWKEAYVQPKLLSILRLNGVMFSCLFFAAPLPYTLSSMTVSAEP